MDHTTALSQTVRVAADGTVTYGMAVPSRVSYLHGEPNILAAPPRSASKGRRFIPAGIPNNVWMPDKSAPYGERLTHILAVTHPHDCANHLEEVPQ